MDIENEELSFNRELRARIKRLREDGGWTAAEMAFVLGIPADRYRKYEDRSNMPLYLIAKFAAIVGRTPEYILVGRDLPRRRNGRISQAQANQQNP